MGVMEKIKVSWLAKTVFVKINSLALYLNELKLLLYACLICIKCV
jgi:hypothetical protein